MPIYWEIGLTFKTVSDPVAFLPSNCEKQRQRGKRQDLTLKVPEEKNLVSSKILYLKQSGGRMERYANNGGNSNVAAYEIDRSSIKVQFRDGSIYLYTNESTGTDNLERLKQLAQAGQGLNSFIGKVIRKGYASKLR